MTNMLKWRVRQGILIAAVIAVTGAVVPAPWAQECRREQWQKVEEILEAMRVRPGAAVADVGAGDGFFTTRLSKAVGPDGQVYAVDISEKALERLRGRLEDANLANVTVIKGAPDDPRLPAATLDAALIINAYHEMGEHQAMLAGIRRALKPDGRLVIVEPISDRRRDQPRAEQVRSHEIAPEHVVADARAAGFKIVGLQDPFTAREHDLEWLLVLQPHTTALSGESACDGRGGSSSPTEPHHAPSLRITIDDFKALRDAGAVTIVDVRDSGSFASGHIPGALLIPLDRLEDAAGQLRTLGKPIVTYCS